LAYKITFRKRFVKRFRKLKRSGIFNHARLDVALRILASGGKLDDSYRDHALGGNMVGLRECHIAGDTLLVYQIDESLKELYLFDIGSHSNLFK